MREPEREALARRVLDLAAGDAIEAIVGSRSLGMTRFTHNAIHQNMASADATVRVRVVAGARTGVATTNDTSEASLAATVARARAIAALAPEDSAAPPLVRTERIATPPGAFAPATDAATPEARATTAEAIFREAEGASLWAAGYVTTATSGITIANSAGTLQSYDATSCGLNVKASGPDATGFAEFYGIDARALDGMAAGARAVAKARAGTTPIAVAPGPWTVILEPAAIGELLSYLTDHFGAQEYDQGSSFLCDGLDRRYVGSNVSMWDDAAHPLFAGMPFDDEGNRRTRVPLFEAGIANRVVTDTRYAAKLGMPNTGHALPAPNAAGPRAQHIVVDSGEKTLEAFIAETERGLLVSRFWYIRPVDARKTILTGMTRDGTFLIEGGQIRGGVNNMRFNQSILEALGECEFARDAARTSGHGYETIVPAVKIEGFRFTSTTDF